MSTDYTQGGRLIADDLIADFKSKVVDWAEAQINDSLTYNSTGEATWSGGTSADPASMSQFDLPAATDFTSVRALASFFIEFAYELTCIRRVQLRKVRTVTTLNISANNVSAGSAAQINLGMNQTRSGSVTASASATATASVATSFDNVGGPRITMLSPRYRPAFTAFKSSLTINNSLRTTGAVITKAHMDALINSIQTRVQAYANTSSTVNVTTCHTSANPAPASRTATGSRAISYSARCCHSSCHGSCHGSRGRR